MQTERPQPAGRRFIVSLAIVVTGLTGCGGGGGSSAPVPPQATSVTPASLLDQAQSAALFDGIASDGEPWLGLVDGDSAIFRLTGDGGGTSASLAKLPPPDHAHSITTTYSKLNYYPAAANSINDPGRYILLGRLTPALPATAPSSLAMPVSGHWTCADCQASGELRQGALAGQLVVHFSTSSAALSAAGDGLDIRGALALAKNFELTGTSPPVLTFDGAAVDLIRSELRGGVFGPDGREAGVMFGAVDTGGRVFSGAVVGEVP